MSEYKCPKDKKVDESLLKRKKYEDKSNYPALLKYQETEDTAVSFDIVYGFTPSCFLDEKGNLWQDIDWVLDFMPLKEIGDLMYFHARTYGLWAVDNKKLLEDNLSKKDFENFVFQII